MNFKITFKLNFQAETYDICPETTSVYRRCKQGSTDNNDKQIGFDNVIPAKIGLVNRITVKTNNFSVNPNQIIPWLARFGSVGGHQDFEKSFGWSEDGHL
jgi:hypothetical protein